MSRFWNPQLRVALALGTGMVVATSLAVHPIASAHPGSLTPAFALAMVTLISDALDARLRRGVWRVSAMAWALTAGVMAIGALAAPYVYGIDPLFWLMLGSAVYCGLTLKSHDCATATR
jgi:xanthine/uracil permease